MSDWTAYRLTPDDVLFFRDGKPSAQGQDHDLRSLFPPAPSTLFGALRTHRLVAEGVALGELREQRWDELLGPALLAELGSWGGFGTLAVRGPWLARGDEALVPAPLDLAITTQGEPSERRVDAVGRFRLAAEPAAGGASHPLGDLEPQRWATNGWERWRVATDQPEPRQATGWWLSAKGFGAWQRGVVPEPEDLIHPRELWVEEPRTGVGLQPGQRTSAEHQLFTFGHIRLCLGVTLAFEASGGSLAPPATLRLGGEGRTARLEPGPALPLTPPSTASRRFWLSLLTPAPSAAGAVPPGFAPAASEGLVAGRRCRLLAASVPGFVLVGGWDLAKGRAKPLRRALPAGAAFLLEDLETDAPTAAARLSGATFSDFPGEHLAQQGFGLVATAPAD